MPYSPIVMSKYVVNSMVVMKGGIQYSDEQVSIGLVSSSRAGFHYISPVGQPEMRRMKDPVEKTPRCRGKCVASGRSSE
jgi:hypothetical protein